MVINARPGTCIVCQKPLQGRSDKLYCSSSCRMIDQRGTVYRKCNRCNKLYPLGERSRSFYCSDECQRQARKDQRQHVPAFDRPFRAWDGEGFDKRYTLLANSQGRYIYNEQGLSTYECLEFLVGSGSGYTDVWFSFGYDVNMILRDIPLTGGYGTLETLYRTNNLRWQDFRIHYVPHKFFSVSRYDKRFSSTDVFGFFQSSFLKACSAWGIDVPQYVKDGKEGRNDFSNTDVWNRDTIIRYNAAECDILVSLMDRLRDAMREAGQYCQRWHGAGALAADWHKRHGTKAYLGDFPREMETPLACAYFGGRIELGAWGSAQDVWNYDINSAYPYGMARCPNLALLAWKYSNSPICPQEPFSLVHVEWKLPDRIQWNPFPWRTKRGGILYPHAGQGWYWAVEVQSAMRRFPSGIRVIESYLPDGPMEYPLREAIYGDFRQRLEWKRDGNAAEKTLKLALNSLYGKTAQRSYDNTRPPYQSTAWAGYITATTRALLSDAILAAEQNGGNVIQVMTDSIFTDKPCPSLELGNELGQWGSKHYQQVNFCGAGLYECIADDGTVDVVKQRGFGSADMDYAGIIDQWEKKQYDALTVNVQRFIGMGLAIVAKHAYRDHFCDFVPMKRHMESVPLKGTTKRLSDAFGGKRIGNLHFQKPRHVTKRDYVPGNIVSAQDINGFQMLVQDLRIPVSHAYDAFRIDGEASEEMQEEKAVEYYADEGDIPN